MLKRKVIEELQLLNLPFIYFWLFYLEEEKNIINKPFDAVKKIVCFLQKFALVEKRKYISIFINWHLHHFFKICSVAYKSTFIIP